MLRPIFITLLAGSNLILACGTKAPAGPRSPESKSPDQASQCLEDAGAPRTPLKDAPAKISLSHILVRHVELASPRGATRSRGAACLRALEALDALKRGDSDWNKIARQFNDSKDDSLGRVAHDELTPAFADAAFALTANELSYVVESDRGFHIILREE